jgi:2-hydroxy-3-keto-5-methylthiopentenyl-1-phosphate phosphatase
MDAVVAALPYVFIVLDFDMTMSEESGQEPMFADNLDRIKEKYKDVYPVETAADYWKIVSIVYKGYDREIAYLQCILDDIEDGTFLRDGHKITVEDLQYYGSKIKLSPGIKEFVVEIKKEWEGKANIFIYIVSVGMKNLILGTGLEELVDGIYASELVAKSSVHVNKIFKLYEGFTKTKAIIEIAKGKELNDYLPSKDYKFDYRYSIVAGDGMSDLSAFGYSRKKGAKAIGVYEKDNMVAFESAHKKIGRFVDCLLPRDYTPHGDTWQIFNEYIAELIAEERCIFPTGLIHEHRKGSIKCEKTINYIRTHFDECKCPNCSPAVSLKWVAPS